MAIHQDGYIKYVRQHVGHTLIYLVTASAIILDDQNRVLMTKRHDFDWWDVVGGAKEMDETLAECAVREAKEETGLDVVPERLVGVYTHPQYTYRYPHGDAVQPWTACFVCRVVGGEIHVDGVETLAAEFRTLRPETIEHPMLLWKHMLRDALSPPNDMLAIEADFVSEHTTPFFEVMRRYIPQKPVIMPGAIMLVQDDHGRILVTLRDDLKVWDLPSGLSDLGESVTRTAIRELQEETGMIAKPQRLLGVYSDPDFMYGRYPNGDEIYGVGAFFQMKAEGGVLRSDGDENRAVAFKTIEEIRQQPNLRPITRRLLLDIENIDRAPFIR